MTIGWIDTSFTYEEAILESEEAKRYGVILLSEHFKNEFTDFESEYQIWYGSRVSAKTFVKSLQFLFKCDSQPYFRGLFTRETQVDARNSQFQLFNDLIKKIYPFLQDDFIIESSKMQITHRNGNFCKGASFENLPRSLAEYTDFWVDEPITRRSSISRTDLLDISGTLRNSYGVKSQKHLTFNPISKKNFIYTDFFAENPLFKSKPLLCNYQHNVFCPTEKIKELEAYKEIDYERYLVDSLGLWGNPSNKNPFIFTFNKNSNTSIHEYEIDKQSYVYISFDFNKTPTSAVLGQVDRITKTKHIFDVITADQSTIQGLTPLQAVCQIITNKYINKGIFSKNFIKVTGDASGKNETANSIKGYSFYSAIRESLNISMAQINVKSKNYEHILSREIINTVFSVEKLIILHNVDTLVDEIQLCYVDDKGSLNKAKDEHGLHTLDAFRYLIELWYPYASYKDNLKIEKHLRNGIENTNKKNI